PIHVDGVHGRQRHHHPWRGDRFRIERRRGLRLLRLFGRRRDPRPRHTVESAERGHGPVDALAALDHELARDLAGKRLKSRGMGPHAHLAPNACVWEKIGRDGGYSYTTDATGEITC